MPPRHPSNRGAIAAYLGVGASFLAYALDERLDIRKWKTIRHRVALEPPIDFTLRARTRPPPIGCAEWPAGRVLLELAVDDCLHHKGSTVLEIGSGIGTAAIGLALAGAATVAATDGCEEALANLRANAVANGLSVLAPRSSSTTSAAQSGLLVARWDAAAGQSAVASLPVPPSQLTHVIGADLVYSGGADGVDVGADEAERGLVPTLAAVLRAAPHAEARLILVDRFSGGAVSALSSNAGVALPSAARDASLVAFERRCAAAGLRVQAGPLPAHVAERVHASQGMLQRLSWFVCGTWDGLLLYTLRLDEPSGRTVRHNVPPGG